MSGDKQSPEAKKQSVEKFWFSGLTPKEQETILPPHFAHAHPREEDKERAVNEYENW